MFALYFLNWSWFLSLLDDQVMHEFDELYSSLIHFILSAHNEDDYALRLSVVNFELNPFTKKVKHVNYELLDMVHLRPKDWLFHGKKYFSEHFLWGAIGGYHYQREKWLDLKEEYRNSLQSTVSIAPNPNNNNSDGTVLGTGNGSNDNDRGDDTNSIPNINGDGNRRNDTLSDPMNISNDNHNDPPPSPPEDLVLNIPWNEKFPRLFWVGFFGCSAYIFQ